MLRRSTQAHTEPNGTVLKIILKRHYPSFSKQFSHVTNCCLVLENIFLSTISTNRLIDQKFDIINLEGKFEMTTFFLSINI